MIPWQGLTPENIFQAVERTLGKNLSNICLKRNSYINRVYELEELESGTRFIIKFYRPGRWTPEMIREEHAFLTELDKKEIPVIPPLNINHKTLFALKSIPYALFPKKGGRAVDEFDKEGWKTLGRTIARIHLVSETHKSSSRMIWKPSIATKHHLDIILKTKYLLPDFKNSFTDISSIFIQKAEPLFKAREFLLLHGDCHKGNLLVRPKEGLFIVDFDDMCVGPPVQDLWMLLPDDLENSQNELSWFLEGYETFKEFDEESLNIIPALRGMRIIHYAAWLAVQCTEPDFQNNFPDSGTKSYWNQLIKDLQHIVYEQLF